MALEKTEETVSQAGTSNGQQKDEQPTRALKVGRNMYTSTLGLLPEKPKDEDDALRIFCQNHRRIPRSRVP